MGCFKSVSILLESKTANFSNSSGMNNACLMLLEKYWSDFHITEITVHHAVTWMYPHVKNVCTGNLFGPFPSSDRHSHARPGSTSPPHARPFPTQSEFSPMAMRQWMTFYKIIFVPIWFDSLYFDEMTSDIFDWNVDTYVQKVHANAKQYKYSCWLRFRTNVNLAGNLKWWWSANNVTSLGRTDWISSRSDVRCGFKTAVFRGQLQI